MLQVPMGIKAVWTKRQRNFAKLAAMNDTGSRCHKSILNVVQASLKGLNNENPSIGMCQIMVQLITSRGLLNPPSLAMEVT